MKKSFIIGAALCCACMFLLPSCSDEKKCWEVSYEVMGVEATIFVYATADEVDSVIKAAGVPDGFTKQAVRKSLSDCYGGGLGFDEK